MVSLLASGGVIESKSLPERPPSAEELTLRRSRFDVEHSGDLFVRVTVQVVKHEYLSKSGRKGFDRALEASLESLGVTV
jgi:hypothetical protein